MAMAPEPLIVGKALVVEGTVKVESANGISQIIKPNSPIYLDDRIDTGSSGSVLIVFNDSEKSQLDLGRMSEILIDEDVLVGVLPDLGDVAIEAALVSDQLWIGEAIEPVSSLHTNLPGAVDSGVEETAATDSISSLDGSASTLTSNYSGDEGLGSIDDDPDMTNLIPPPEDAS